MISDITGTTGLAIIDAILAGNCDPQALTALRDSRIRASKDTIAKSLVGDYRREHLFSLRQSVDLYREYQQGIAACEEEMQRFMKGMEASATFLANLPAVRCETISEISLVVFGFPQGVPPQSLAPYFR